MQGSRPKTVPRRGGLAGLGVAALLLVAGPATAADAAKGEQIASTVCAACHGKDGNSTSPANPKLAAQHPEYLQKQLRDFKPAAGAKTAARVSAVMAGFAATLSDADMANVAAYFSSQKLKPAAAKAKELAEAGKAIYRGGIASKNIPACAGCHSPNGAGIPAQYPRLAGQYADYIEHELVAFRQGKRRNSAQMEAIAARMSDDEIKAVADYVAGLR